ncbi:MAG: TonB family protein, partial [Candidatus Omnitrophica bacterium]|nr:TonB family protein [Candidatus Omnitrophota bacterium]
CRLFKIAIIFGTSFFLCLALAASDANAGDSGVLDSALVEEINMIKGELVVLKVYSLTRVSVADPGIADIADANDQEILLVGQRNGETAVFLWDENGKQTIMVYVYNRDLDLMESRIKRLLKDADIYEVKVAANEQEGKVVLTGEIPEDKRFRYDEVIMSFGEDTMNLVEDEVIEDLVQVDMQITELTTTLTESLGIDWSTGGVSGLAPQYQEDVPEFDGSMGDYFKIGDFTRAGQLVAAINALVTEGKGRVLSKPKIVVISGNEARFLVGGEVPIRTTTFSDTGSSQENVEFKEFGISMTITPTIKREKVDILMNLEVSEIDASTATSVSEDVAFSTRSASTHLFLDDGQTIVLAGLIKHSESETMSKIPFIGDIPVIGALFRSRVNPVPQTDQELVIALTPHILRQRDPGAAQNDSAGQGKNIYRGLGGTRTAYENIAPYYLGIPREMTGYVHGVQQKISQSIVYPPEARQYGWEGTVKVGVLILNDGTLAFALVKESSGHDVFDESAVSTTKRLAPFSAFPPDTDLQELNVTIPIVYSLSEI